MIVFRARQWGTAAWTLLSIGGDEDAEMQDTIAAVIGSALGTSELHVQRLSDEGEWEDLE